MTKKTTTRRRRASSPQPEQPASYTTSWDLTVIWGDFAQVRRAEWVTYVSGRSLAAWLTDLPVKLSSPRVEHLSSTVEQLRREARSRSAAAYPRHRATEEGPFPGPSTNGARRTRTADLLGAIQAL